MNIETEEDPTVFTAKRANRLGFPVAGWVRDLYEDAVVLVAPSTNDLHIEDNELIMGRVLTVLRGPNNVYHFVLLNSDGIQVTYKYGPTWICYFALPEDTETKFRDLKN